MAISEYEDVALRYAGSLPDGTDVEYSPRPYIVAADERYATRAELAALRREVAHLERLLHKAINAGGVDEVGAPKGSNTIAESAYWQARREREQAECDTRRAEDDAADLAMQLARAESERDTHTTELETLRAFQASVPWGDMDALLYHAPPRTPGARTVRDWYRTYSPALEPDE